ncbi:MAG: class I SAM-dependent methyltransferase [Planctomycetota bacterium]
MFRRKKKREAEAPNPEIEIKWKKPLKVLREKWGEVPAAGLERAHSKSLIKLSDEELLSYWREQCEKDTRKSRFTVRGWYHLLYSDVLKGKKIMDVGSGMGIDGITFARCGAKMTFVDIVESNLKFIERLCKILDVKDATFCHLEEFASLDKLPYDYDVIWCQGSMINAPYEIMCDECAKLLEHLPVGGRWIELAYPKTRWEREGKLPFDKWGEKTDGSGTPWVEWYDTNKLLKRLSPAEFEVVLEFEFHNGDFNWFDLVRRA